MVKALNTLILSHEAVTTSTSSGTPSLGVQTLYSPSVQKNETKNGKRRKTKAWKEKRNKEKEK